MTRHTPSPWVAPQALLEDNAPYVPNRPVTRQDPACFECGPRQSPDYGCVFIEPAALGWTSVWFDRDGWTFAMSTRRQIEVGQTVVIHGRSFEVRDWTDIGKTLRAPVSGLFDMEDGEESVASFEVVL